jgi:hypothetical protein
MTGVGKLLMSCQQNIDPVLVLWSNNSYHASYLNPIEQTWEESKKGFGEIYPQLIFFNKFSYVLPIALNEEKGIYKVKATDIISGFSKEINFKVE